MIQDTTERQLVTRSGLERLQCCVCHLHHKRAMNAPGSVRQFFKTMLQHVHNFKVDVIAGDANAAAYKYFQKHQYQDLYNSSVAIMLREMQREVSAGRPFESRLHMDYFYNNHSVNISSASDLDRCFMALLSKILRKHWSNSRERMPSHEKRQDEDSSYPKGIEVLLRETTKQNYPNKEDVDNVVVILFCLCRPYDD